MLWTAGNTFMKHIFWLISIVATPTPKISQLCWITKIAFTYWNNLAKCLIYFLFHMNCLWDKECMFMSFSYLAWERYRSFDLNSYIWPPIIVLFKVFVYNTTFNFRWPICHNGLAKMTKMCMEFYKNVCAIATFRLMYLLAGDLPQCLVDLLM